MAIFLVFVGILSVVNIAVAAPEVRKLVVVNQKPPGNPCKSHPCLNNGLCLRMRNQKFMCDCAEGFVGKLCESSSLDTPELTCPITQWGGFGNCIIECEIDLDCKESTKGCCSTGCGKQCLEMVKKAKPDPRCPRRPFTRSARALDPCTTECIKSEDCRGSSRGCCYNGCSNQCFWVGEKVPDPTTVPPV